MSRRAVWIFVCLAVAGATAWGQGPFDPVQVIARSNDALEGLRYEGRRLVTNFDLLGRKTEVEYREYFDGARQGVPLRRLEYVRDSHLQGIIMVDDGRFVWQYNPRTKRAIRQRSGPHMLPEVLARRTELLLENYDCRERGMEQVAGRKCYVVELLPRVPGNPSRTVYADVFTYLPLKTVNLRGTGTLKSISEFTSINFHPRFGKDLFAVPRDVVVVGGISREGPYDLQRAAGRLGVAIRTPKYLPPGYVFAGAHCLWGAGGARAVHLLYFDGLSTISLFEEPTTHHVVERWLPAGSVHEFRWADGAMKYTLIGDIVPAELARIKDSL